MSNYPKKLNGLCVGILSGDRVLFQGPPDHVNGGYKQKILHLSGIQAPKVDTVNGNDQKFGFAARQFLRKRLVGKQLPFVVEKKVNEIELGYVTYQGEDIIVTLLTNGLVKLRGQNIKCEHSDDYKNAEEEARMAQVGLWSEEKKPKDAYRYLARDVSQKQLVQKYKGKSLKGIVEQIHPSKASIYFPEQGLITTLSFSEVQVVVLSQKVNNQTVKSNVRTIRSVLESSFLQRQVDVHITGYGQNLTGYLTNASLDDVRKVLLKNGFAKLSKDAMNNISTKEFMELKRVAQVALEEGKGLWKQQQVNKTEKMNEKSFQATVYEVNSGDSLTIWHPLKNAPMRIFFPNARAPSTNQPFSFEAKETLRKKVIGQKVKVEVQFSKNLNVKTGEGDKTENRTFVFASIFLQNVNVACYMLEHGLINLQPPRVQENVSKYFENLREAEQKGKKQRKGLYGNLQAKVPTFNDLSGGKGKKIDANKSKNLFPFLRDQKHLTGVIDLVLNGTRFKMRFNNQPILAIMVLDGVRALPNEGEFKKISEKALQYSKNHALQRDVEIQLKKVDLKGVFQGTIYINKKDFAIDLLEKGLAVCMTGGKFGNRKYEEAEALARKNKLGLWAESLNLSAIKGVEKEKVFEAVNFSKNGIIVEVNSRYEFYVEPDNCKRPDVPQNPKFVDKVNVGGLYSAQFEGEYYRARIRRQINGKYEVFYIDYGNKEVLPKSTKFGQLSENLKKVPSAIYKCQMYGLDGLTQEGEKTLKALIGANLKIQFNQRSEPLPGQQPEYRVTLWEKNNCINLEMIEFGDAECTIANEQWNKAEETARRNREGRWANQE